MRTFCRYIALTFLLCGMVLPLSAQQGDGLSCENPIRVDSTYTGTFDAGSYYFTAWTYDLPLTVYVFPASGVKGVKPQLLADFTCTPGVYDDPDIDRMAHGVNDFGISLPFDMLCQEDEVNGKFAWRVDFTADMKICLAMFSVTKDIQAIVKLTIYERSTATLMPTLDPCDSIPEITVPNVFDNMLLDTTQIYKFPIGELAHGNVRVRWTGQDTTMVYMGSDCSFPVDNPFDSRFYDYMQLSPDKGNGEDTYLFVSKDMLDMAASQYIFNLYFRFQGGPEGMIIFEDAGDAKRLHLDTPQPINANDQSTTYSIPVSWKDVPIRFYNPKPYATTMYVSTEPFFSIEQEAIAAYSFSSDDAGGGELCLSSVEMMELASMTTDSLLYVKFLTTSATTITPVIWESSVCAVKTATLYIGEERNISRNSSVTYRIPLKQWAKGDITLQWKDATQPLNVWWADTCDFMLSKYNPSVHRIDTIPVGESKTIIQADLLQLPTDMDGFVYFRLRSKREGVIYITSSAPIIPEPEPKEYQSATISIRCIEDNRFAISVSKEQDLQLLDSQGEVVESWHQSVDETISFSVINLVGTYFLKGNDEIIVIK